MSAPLNVLKVHTRNINRCSPSELCSCPFYTCIVEYQASTIAESTLIQFEITVENLQRMVEISSHASKFQEPGNNNFLALRLVVVISMCSIYWNTQKSLLG